MDDRRFCVNISPTERIGRIAVGLAAVAIAIALFREPGPAGAAALKVLLGLAGLDLVFTGATGHCPLYKALGHVPASLKGKNNDRYP
ncbi:YgaP family membrane protein [Knoellia subterranea]|uniref:YgaP family membrane protein n=1 Tax=Knoellia subterranea TaxID=184882 RepID=UPI000A068D05|nr:DUF2892 domain-containing protein [Knoellia subterranea]